MAQLSSSPISASLDPSNTTLHPDMINKTYVSNEGFTYSSGGDPKFSSAKGLSVGAIICIIVGVLIVGGYAAHILSYILRNRELPWPFRKRSEQRNTGTTGNNTGSTRTTTGSNRATAGSSRASTVTAIEMDNHAGTHTNQPLEGQQNANPHPGPLAIGPHGD